MALKRAAKRERHEATGVADVAAVTVGNCLRGAQSGAESQLTAGALATDLPGFPRSRDTQTVMHLEEVLRSPARAWPARASYRPSALARHLSQDDAQIGHAVPADGPAIDLEGAKDADETGVDRLLAAMRK